MRVKLRHTICSMKIVAEVDTKNNSSSDGDSSNLLRLLNSSLTLLNRNMYRQRERKMCVKSNKLLFLSHLKSELLFECVRHLYILHTLFYKHVRMYVCIVGF